MRKIIFTVLAAIAAITSSATQRSSWPSTSDDVCLTTQVSKYPKYPATSCSAVDVEPVGSWPAY